MSRVRKKQRAGILRSATSAANYDVVGVFNFDEQRAAPTYVSWKDLGLPEGHTVHVYDFWNKEYLGAWEKGITVDLSPTSSLVLTLLPQEDRRQLISTSRHLTQCWVDLVSHAYNPVAESYRGRSRVIKNDPYQLSFVFPRGRNFVVKAASARSARGSLPVKISVHQGWDAVEFDSPLTTEVSWNVSFAPTGLYRFPVREPQNLWAERVGIDGANLRWQVPHQPAIGYQVTLNGQLLGATTTQVFALKDLDPNANYTAEVRTAWQDGKISEKKAELKFTLKQLLPQEVFLSELSPLRITAGWRQTEFNRNFNSGGLSIGGRPFEKGIGMPTNSEIGYELNGTYEKFSALVGIDDEHNNKDSVVEFSVLGDGKELWRSGGWKKADGAKTVKVDVKNVRRLMLRVKREGEGGRVHADWVDAKLVK
ncbi:MAG: NPCBM/NEW2 domain-containing protein [Pyrinomonadaceae bacterium]